MQLEPRDKDEAAGALSVRTLWELCARHPRLLSITVAAFLVGALGVVAMRSPSYRARATLILDDTAGSGGILGELAMLGRAPQAASQIELLRARSTVEDTIAVSAARPGTSAFAAESERHLGLTTRVEDPLLHPLWGFFTSQPTGSGPPSRLRAFAEPLDRTSSGACELEAEFLSDTLVRVRTVGWRTRLGVGGGEAVEAELSNQPLEIAGLRLWLVPEGDLGGRSFRIVQLAPSEALRLLLKVVRVRETERGSGVIELTVDDSDPRRAAEIANAICRNYLVRNKLRGERRASQTIEFIGEQLESQTRSLSQAESEVVELQRLHPRAIDVAKSGEALIDQLSALEVQRMQVALLRVSLRQALELLDGGDLDALSRLSAELSDPITAAYLESIAGLSAEHAMQARSDAGPYKAMLQQRGLEVEAELDRTELEIRSLERTLAALDAGDHDVVAQLGGGPPAARDPLLESTLDSLGELHGRLDTMRSELTSGHPDRQLAERRIADAIGRVRILLDERLTGRRAQKDEQLKLLASYAERRDGYPEGERVRIDGALASLRARAAIHLESRLSGLEASERALTAELERYQASLGELPEEQRRIADPLRRLAAHSAIVQFLLEKQQEAEITRASTMANAEFIDKATPPWVRNSPSVPLHAAAGLVLGLLAALGLAFAKETLAPGIFTSSELELATELPVLGVIPHFRRGRYRVRGAGSDFVPLRDDPEGISAEAVRSLRASLKFLITGDPPVQVLAATSCTPGEGKSLTNIDLALAFARAGRRVLLIDCDLRRPSVHRYLRLERSPGLAEVLEGRVEFTQVVRRDVLERLDVLTAGEQPRTPSDLLEGDAFVQLVSAAKLHYDLVVCDVPPAFAVADVESMANCLDGMLLVVHSNRVSGQLVASVVRRLRQSGVRLLGAVLNGVGTSIANGRYGDGYGYGYGYGEGYKHGNGRSHERVAG